MIRSITCACGRILFPTRVGRYPDHMDDLAARTWCPRGGQLVQYRAKRVGA